MPEEFPAYRPEDPSSAELWDALELPPPSPVPIGFAGRVVSYCQERSQEKAVFVQPGWARLATASALLLGLGVLAHGLAVFAYVATGWIYAPPELPFGLIAIAPPWIPLLPLLLLRLSRAKADR